MEFETATIPPDSVPELAEVEYPCRNCNKEAGPYGGRGPKPKLCPDCKPAKTVSRGVKVTGNTANLAAQATMVLSQLNGMMCLGLMAVGMNETASAIAAGNDLFEERANQALLTDPELCKMILKSGVKSAKVNLMIAYGGLAVSVMPSAVNELREKKAERDAKREAEQDETRT